MIVKADGEILQTALALQIGKDWYRLKRIMDEPPAVRLRWQLTKLKDGAEPHIVTLLKSKKVSCDCEDATFRNNKSCKHLAALRDEGLLPKE